MSAIGEMASVMAQDINKPLTAIIKDIKTVRQSVVDDNLDTDGLSDLLEETIIRGQQASSVITNLLNFSAGGGGEKTKSNLCKVMNGSLDLANDVLSVTDNLRFSQVQVDKQYADNLPDISCHTTELQQVFLSLFRHACHALDEIDYKPKISISIDMSFDDIWVRIQHNGKTIELEDQKTLFEPFNQENALSKEVATGTHLSFAHFIITEQHQGQIAVTSNKEDGTTFHIQLPTQ
jgi:signal transduction histidine kinase